MLFKLFPCNTFLKKYRLIIPILQIRKLRLRDNKKLPWNIWLINNREESLNTVFLILKSQLWSTTQEPEEANSHRGWNSLKYFKICDMEERRSWLHSKVQACVLSCFSRVSLQPYGLQAARLLCPRDSPGKNTGMGCHAIFQGILPTQGWNPSLLCLLHWQMGS